MSEYIRQRRCDGNAGLASIRERRMQRGGPGLFSGKRTRGFAARGSQGRSIRTCSYGRPLYESYILKTQEKVAPIFFLRAQRTGWRTRRAQCGQDKDRRQQEFESMSTILFLELQLATSRNENSTTTSSRTSSSRPELGRQSENCVLSRIPDREHWWVIDRVEGTIIMFRYAESEKVDGSIFFCSQCCWIFTGTQYV